MTPGIGTRFGTRGIRIDRNRCRSTPTAEFSAPTPILTWPSARVYKAIATDLDGYAKKSRSLLRKRANCYKWSLLGVPAGVVGLALLWLDATL